MEIFYGSFLKVYPEATDAEFAAELRRTLHHELTHHIEGLAGDRTLERWDEEQTALWREGGAPLRADSILWNRRELRSGGRGQYRRPETDGLYRHWRYGKYIRKT